MSAKRQDNVDVSTTEQSQTSSETIGATLKKLQLSENGEQPKKKRTYNRKSERKIAEMLHEDCQKEEGVITKKKVSKTVDDTDEQDTTDVVESKKNPFRKPREKKTYKFLEELKKDDYDDLCYKLKLGTMNRTRLAKMYELSGNTLTKLAKQLGVYTP